MPYKSLASLEPNARELAAHSTVWMDSFWDESAGLLWYPGYEGPDHAAPRRHHLVRDTAWHTVGLFLRRQGADVFRAMHAIDAILDTQFNAPDQVYHGTFARSPEEPLPPLNDAVIWQDYDPNWREFIITTLQILLAEFEPLLPYRLVERIDSATRLAVEGALARGLRPNYTNIALMHAFMLAQAGSRLGEPHWLAQGEAMARDVYRLFDATGAFEEYNSPTYYGVDLHALALWRSYAASPYLQSAGADMEARLWRDLARYYHPGLHNLCGPYDRSYGMDMTRYAAVVGEWIGLVTGLESAPFPRLNLPFAHTSDLYFAPCAAILGAAAPAEACAQLLSFTHPRQVNQVITHNPLRMASAWLEERFMWGGETTGGSKPGSAGFHPLTLHWQAAPGEAGWMRLAHHEPVDAKVNGRTVTIQARGWLTFMFHAPGLDENTFQPDRWTLPGLTITLAAPAVEFNLSRQPEWFEVSYTPFAPGDWQLILTASPT